MKYIVFVLASLLLFESCSKEVLYPAPCVNCKLQFQVDTLVTPGVTKSNGFICIPHGKVDYFTIEAQMSEIDSMYIINNVPLVKIEWDSDYWVVFKSIGFRYSMYSPFGYILNDGTKIPVKDTTFIWTDFNPPTNIVGYTYNANRIGGIETKYGYYFRKSIFYSSEMIGDTCTVYLKATWNTDYVGERKQIIDSLQIIFE